MLKEKDIFLMQVKINNTNLDMQMDTGNKVTLIPRNIWEQLGKPKWQKTYLYLQQFDACYTNQWGFEGLLELDKRFETMPVIVVNCTKHHGLVGNYVLKLNSIKLINAVNAEVKIFHPAKDITLLKMLVD